MGRQPWNHTASRHERGYDSKWVRLRAAILLRDMYLCQPCHASGRTTLATEVDHIKRKADGGTDDGSNLQAICHACHSAKNMAEAAEAQGKARRPGFGIDGWPLPR